MRDPIFQTTPALPKPSQDARDKVTLGPRTEQTHIDLLANWGCLNHVEIRQPAPGNAHDIVTVAAWNIERCKRVSESAQLLRENQADIVLATEMDLGMARSGQKHTTRDLADALEMGYAFGVEFVELGTGDPYETGLFKDVPNNHGLHGNAILSRYAIENVALLPLDSGGRWFTDTPKNDGQFRIGGRMAIAAQVGSVTFVAVHYESESDANGRADQTQRMLDLVDQEYGRGPCIIGGDLNTAAFARKRMSGIETMEDPFAAEPSFTAFAEAGFDWQNCNLPGFTTRAAPGRPVRYPLSKLDWLFARDVTVSAPAILPAICDRGDYLSDHELITTKVAL